MWGREAGRVLIEPDPELSCLHIDPDTKLFPALAMCTPEEMMNGQPDKAFARHKFSRDGFLELNTNSNVPVCLKISVRMYISSQ